MNQKKIGSFISEIRKEKNMTQKDLAEKLNVSINAVSKWERGLCLMDISLLSPLSAILNVSIAEIINGERLNNSELTNEVIEKTIAYYEQKRKENRRKKCLKVLLLIFCILIIIVFVCKVVLLTIINTMENNISSYANVGKRNYNDSIYIYKRNVTNYYTFKDIELENVFENSINKNVSKYVETYEFSNDKIIALTIDIDKDDVLESIDNSILLKYAYKNHLTSENKIYKFLANFNFQESSIFNSIFSLKDYLLKLEFYTIYNSSFDEYYKLNGSYDGDIIIFQNIIWIKIDGLYNRYAITFKNYTFDEALNVIDTINFIE